MLFTLSVDQSPADPYHDSPPDYYELYGNESSSCPSGNAPAVCIPLATPTDPVRPSAAIHSSSSTTIIYPVVTAEVTQIPPSASHLNDVNDVNPVNRHEVC